MRQSTKASSSNAAKKPKPRKRHQQKRSTQKEIDILETLDELFDIAEADKMQVRGRIPYLRVISTQQLK